MLIYVYIFYYFFQKSPKIILTLFRVNKTHIYQSFFVFRPLCVFTYVQVYFDIHTQFLFI